MKLNFGSKFMSALVACTFLGFSGSVADAKSFEARSMVDRDAVESFGQGGNLDSSTSKDDTKLEVSGRSLLGPDAFSYIENEGLSVLEAEKRVRKLMKKSSYPPTQAPIPCPPTECPVCPAPPLGSLGEQLQEIGMGLGTTDQDTWIKLVPKIVDRPSDHGGNQVLTAAAASNVNVLNLQPKYEGLDRQNWHYTGDSALKNKQHGYIGLDDNGGIVFRDRDHNDSGQTWDINNDGQIKNRRFQNSCLNVYGGRVTNYGQVGMYSCGGGGRNAQWIQSDFRTPISKPEVVDVTYHGFQLDTTSVQIPGIVYSYFRDGGALFELDQETYQSRSTQRTWTANVALSDTFKASVSAGVNIAIFSASTEVSNELSINAAFTWGAADNDEQGIRTTVKTTYQVPEGEEWCIFHSGMTYHGRIPYTMTFSDGSTLNSFMSHVQAFGDSWRHEAYNGTNCAKGV